MVILPFNLCGYRFQRGIKDIRRAYDATIAALELLHANAQSDMLELQAAVVAGELNPIEYDENGERLYDREDLQRMLVDDAAATIPIARGSYIIVLHHHWEKHCKQWMKAKKDYNAEDAYKWLEQRGISVDCIQLESLRRTANTIKHKSAELAEQLGKEDVDKIFDAVSRSGLQPDTP